MATGLMTKEQHDRLRHTLGTPKHEFWISARAVGSASGPEEVRDILWHCFQKNGVRETLEDYMRGDSIEFLWFFDDSKMAYCIRVYDGKDAELLRIMKEINDARLRNRETTVEQSRQIHCDPAVGVRRILDSPVCDQTPTTRRQDLHAGTGVSTCD